MQIKDFTAIYLFIYVYTIFLCFMISGVENSFFCRQADVTSLSVWVYSTVGGRFIAPIFRSSSECCCCCCCCYICAYFLHTYITWRVCDGWPERFFLTKNGINVFFPSVFGAKKKERKNNRIETTS